MTFLSTLPTIKKWAQSGLHRSGLVGEHFSYIYHTHVDNLQILDNVLITHICIDFRHKERRLDMVCKLNFDKPYDMVVGTSWNTLFVG